MRQVKGVLKNLANFPRRTDSPCSPNHLQSLSRAPKDSAIRLLPFVNIISHYQTFVSGAILEPKASVSR
jgi:hypothetical protein